MSFTSVIYSTSHRLTNVDKVNFKDILSFLDTAKPHDPNSKDPEEWSR